MAEEGQTGTGLFSRTKAEMGSEKSKAQELMKNVNDVAGSTAPETTSGNWFRDLHKAAAFREDPTGVKRGV